MIRFIVRVGGGGLFIFATSGERHIRDRVYISFLRNNRMFETKLNAEWTSADVYSDGTVIF